MSYPSPPTMGEVSPAWRTCLTSVPMSSGSAATYRKSGRCRSARSLVSCAPKFLSPLRYAPYVQSPSLDIPEHPHHATQNTYHAHAHVSYRSYAQAPAPAPVHMMIAPRSLDRVVEPTGGSAGSHSDSEVQQRLALPPASKAVAKQLGMDLKTDGSWSDVKTWKAERVNNLMKMTEM